MYKFVIFDIDGTLMDTEKAIICALQKLLRIEKNISYSAQDLLFVLGIPGKEALSKLKLNDTEQLLSKWNGYLSEYVSYIKLFPEIEKTIKCLYAANVKTGIVTSKTKQEYKDDFMPFGLNHYFEFVVCADDTQNHKPHPDPLVKCLRMASVLPHEAIYIGDTIYDKQCADSAGVDFALALWGARNKGIDSKYKFSNPSEILNTLHICSKQFINT